MFRILIKVFENRFVELKMEIFITKCYDVQLTITFMNKLKDEQSSKQKKQRSGSSFLNVSFISGCIDTNHYTYKFMNTFHRTY